ncbi:hypothetical protein ACFLYN_02350, partial [Chloroflexota bacterium]
GVAHLIPTKAIVSGFGEISEDNKKILTMELIAEGLTLIFIGVLILLVTLFGGSDSQVSKLMLWACAAMLFVMALLTALTGARTAGIPYKICPFVKTAVAVLIILGVLL